jgi:hypothetical protein
MGEIMEPTSTAAGGLVISKGAAAIAALFGGLSVSFFYQPKRLHQFGRLAAGAIIGGISVGASFALAGLIATQVGLDFNDFDTALGIGYVVGMMSVGVIAWIANFLQKREEKDILEVAQELRGKVAAPIKRTTVRKTPAKTPTKRVRK